MVRTVVSVDGMSCEHCVKAITKAVRALPGVFDVTVDLKAKTVTTEHGSALTADKIKREIEEQGYGITD